MSNDAQSNHWVEIILESSEAISADTLESVLFEAGALSVTLTSKEDEIILVEPNPGDLPLWESTILVTGLFDDSLPAETLCLTLSQLMAPNHLPLNRIKTITDKPWENEWTKHFSAQLFGQHLWVCPSHESPPSNQITKETAIITLDPGMAFGTGSHPTTAMALEYIATHAFKGKNVVDYGCGSGILGIAAVKMGASHCLMTDIDDVALKTAQANAKQNDVDDKMTFYLPQDVPNTPADILIANILLNPLLTLKDTFAELCHDQTTILLTGLLHHQTEQIIAHYSPEFSDFTTHQLGDWSLITATRQSTKPDSQ